MRFMKDLIYQNRLYRDIVRIVVIYDYKSQNRMSTGIGITRRRFCSQMSLSSPDGGRFAAYTGCPIPGDSVMFVVICHDAGAKLVALPRLRKHTRRTCSSICSVWPVLSSNKCMTVLDRTAQQLSKDIIEGDQYIHKRNTTQTYRTLKGAMKNVSEQKISLQQLLRS